MKYISLLLLTILFSCSTVVERDFERVQTDEYYRDSGAAVYFLPLIPQWRDYSSASQCSRSAQIRYLNIKNLMTSFSVDHQNASQIQYAFNKIYREKAKGMDRSPTLKEVEQIFFSANDLVSATGGYLKRPKFKNVNIIWFDSYRENLSRLSRLMNSKSMLQGRPIFVSTCFLEDEMKSMMKKANVVYEGAFFVDFSYLTYFDEAGELTSEESLYIRSYLEKSVKNIRIYSNSKRPSFVKGRYKFIKY